MIYKIKTVVWITKDKVPWHFVSIDKNLSKEIKANQWFRRGFDSVPVSVKVGVTKWKTSIFMTKTGEYLLPIKLAVRKAEGIKEGDEINIFVRLNY